MHYVTRSSHRMQKHTFGITCPDAHFIEIARARKIVHQCFASGCTGLHYVTRKSHRMQKHMFGIMCPRVLFMKTAPDPPEHENSVSMFRIPDVPECITSPEDPMRCKNTSSRVTCPDALFMRTAQGPPKQEIVCRRFVPRTHRNALCCP
jgi:hypothetical protein